MSVVKLFIALEISLFECKDILFLRFYRYILYLIKLGSERELRGAYGAKKLHSPESFRGTEIEEIHRETFEKTFRQNLTQLFCKV
jgi:hypothetical protein